MWLSLWTRRLLLRCFREVQLRWDPDVNQGRRYFFGHLCPSTSYTDPHKHKKNGWLDASISCDGIQVSQIYPDTKELNLNSNLRYFDKKVLLKTKNKRICLKQYRKINLTGFVTLTLPLTTTENSEMKLERRRFVPAAANSVLNSRQKCGLRVFQMPSVCGDGGRNKQIWSSF